MTTSTTTVPAAARPRRPRRLLRRVLKYGSALLVALFAWVAFDLYAPRQTSLREFDADAVARLETAMWRSHYSREHVKLFGQLAELLQTRAASPKRTGAV